MDKLYETQPNSRYAVAEDVFGEKYEAEGLGKKVEGVAALINWALSEIPEKEE